MNISCRLLPYIVADGPWNMAADDALLDSAATQGLLSLRFYGWSSATLSLGYFQPHASARAYPLLETLPWIRRCSGGAALVHHHEITYALALPAGSAYQSPQRSWLRRFHEVIQSALATFGVTATVCDTENKQGEVLCFRHHTPGDLLLGAHKVVGSAQRKQRGALMQHGGILLRQSAFTPELQGITELSGILCEPGRIERAVIAEFSRATGWEVTPGEWTDSEREILLKRRADRYLSAQWNEKR